MASFLATLLTVSLLAVLQSSVASSLHLGLARVDVVLLVVVSWALVRDHAEAVKWGLLGGLAVDLLSVSPPGTHTLALAITAVASTFALSLGMEGAPVQVATVALATVLYRALALGILAANGLAISWDLALLEESLASAALNGLLAPFVCWLLYGINRRARSERKRVFGT